MLKYLPIAALSLFAAALTAAPASAQDAAAGAKLYASNCSACHGPDRAGMPGTFPALTDVNKRLDPKQIKEKIQKGGGLMPPFGQLSQKDVEDIAAFLKQ
ncbi:Glucose dehydrogenase, PQQ-dependent [Lysobacter capsici AZ78]|uniref:Glucose dehydrogenase, PQQ-dependent n=1 Tax=Lysobacter capsici AZ78 TaxID=1444315 RepID=A0A108UBH2_9GAMM|nr:cytochrome c [Lysobacter capsici]ATE73813.1 cytochrome C [Lysobacter capsici]KWS06101.1 Glucose dehydrogenase, PQQ-dependent [Lysobacter capsici AZ78]WND80046.1 cytochrome c [Lysobacter capsici]WND85242.1 cytochrome c [Lysobacter capsici]